MKARCLLLAASMAAMCVRGYTLVNVPDGETLEFSSSDNASEQSIIFGSGCTLKLTGSVSDGLFTLNTCIVATNAALTVDATGLSGCTGIRWCSDVTTKEPIVVKGTDRILFGSTGSCKADSIHLTCLYSDFTFVDGTGAAIASPAGVVCTNGVTLGTIPTCPWSVAKGTWLWPYNVTFPDSHVDTFDLAEYNYGVMFGDSLNASAIRVTAGRGVSMRPCSVYERSGETGYWRWAGGTGAWNRDVILDGGVLWLVANQTFTLSGAVTGMGDIRYVGNQKSTLNGVHSVTGTVYVSGNELAFVGEGGGNPGSVESVVVFGSSSTGRLALKPTGSGSSYTAAYVKSVTGLSTSNIMEVQPLQTLTIGTANGTLRIQGPVDSEVVVSNLDVDAQLMVPDGMKVTVLRAGYGSKIALANDNGTGAWRLNGAVEGRPAEFTVECETASPSLTLGGRIALGTIPDDLASVVILDGAEVSGDFPSACEVRSFGGKRTLALGGWSRKVALWCDASATRVVAGGSVTNTFAYATEISPNAASQPSLANCIWKWFDCRPWQTKYAFGNKRYTSTATGSFSTAVFPYEADDGDIHYVSMGDGSGNRNAGHLNIFDLESGGQKADIAAEYAIAVFGSQNGGGSAVFGNQEGAFSRDGYGKTKANASVYCISTNYHPTYVNGTLVDPTVTKLNGGWQIISIDAGGTNVQGIGFCENGTNAQPKDRGYSRYAEVLIFSERPTDTERMQVEEYLASKWGIDISHSNTLAQQSVAVSGFGELALNASAELSGAFSGTVDLNGHVLKVPDTSLPFTAAEIPSEGLTVWFDPSFPGSLVMGTDPAMPHEVDAMMARRNDGLATSGLYLQAPYSSNGVTNRRASVSIGSRGGVADKWLDFRGLYGHTTGNIMMLRPMPYTTPIANYADKSGVWLQMSYSTVFMVLDSTYGGGNPFPSLAGGGTGYDVVTRGTSPAVSSPIWAAGCSEKILNGSTWLDGVSVNGAEHGFFGRPEVLSFTVANGTSSTKSLSCVNTKPNQEVIAETLFYTNSFTAEVRAGIEAYLMEKWLGKVPDGFSDFRNVTVTGDGVVIAPDVKHLPVLGVGFTGSVVLSADTLSFAFDGSSTVASNAMSLPGTDIAFPAEVAVNLSFASSPSPGVRYTLIAGDIDVSATEFTLGTVSGAGNRKLSLAYDGQSGELYVEAKAFGFVLSIK